MKSVFFCLIRRIFGWYNFWGYISTAMGALTAGYFILLMTNMFEVSTINAYRSIIVGYAIFGVIKGLLYSSLSNEVEVKVLENKKLNWFDKNFGLHQSS